MSIRSIIIWSHVADGFAAAYEAEHVPLIRTVPGLERFRVSALRSRTGGVVAELTFADAGAMKAGYASPQGEALLAHSDELQERFTATLERHVTTDAFVKEACGSVSRQV